MGVASPGRESESPDTVPTNEFITVRSGAVLRQNIIDTHSIGKDDKSARDTNGENTAEANSAKRTTEPGCNRTPEPGCNRRGLGSNVKDDLIRRLQTREDYNIVQQQSADWTGNDQHSTTTCSNSSAVASTSMGRPVHSTSVRYAAMHNTDKLATQCHGDSMMTAKPPHNHDAVATQSHNLDTVVMAPSRGKSEVTSHIEDIVMTSRSGTNAEESVIPDPIVGSNFTVSGTIHDQ